MNAAIPALANRLHVLKLSARHARFAGAIAVRRLVETVYTKAPHLAASRPLPHPVEIVVAINSACQLSCAMCGIRTVMKEPRFRGRSIAHADLAPAIREIGSWTVRPYVKFTGGEPLLIEDELLAMLTDCRDRRIPTRVSTNGVRLADPDVARALVDCEPDVVTISLDGPEPIHNAIRGWSKAYASSVRGIRNLHAAKVAAGRHAPLIQVSSVIHARNAGALEPLHRICTELPIQWWNVQLLNFVTPDARDDADRTATEWGYGPGPWSAFVNDDLRAADVGAMAAAAARIRARRSPFAVSFQRAGDFGEQALRAYFAGSRIAREKRLCVVPFLAMHIVPNGDMAFCIDYPNVAYGNIATHTLQGGWTSPEARRFRGLMLDAYRSGGDPPSQCNRCNWMFN